MKRRNYTSKIYVVKTGNRREGISDLLKNFSLRKMKNKLIALKPNYNSADPFPASTHLETLSLVVQKLKEVGSKIVLAERSGMGNTRSVLEKTGVMALGKKLEFDVVILDEYTHWYHEKPEKSHWKRGYLFAGVFAEADAVVQICCLKTHRFGGHFTMSLKNSVGMIAKYGEDGYNYMSELHSSPHMRKMIAEINTSYSPSLIVMDAIKGFSAGGPEAGNVIGPGLIIAGEDRIAVDAVGVAILRIHGTTREVSKGSIFEQEQIARASELGLGVADPSEIELVPVNTEAEEMCEKIEKTLRS